MFKHVLIPLDGSELSERALTYAQEIIAPTGILTLLTVVNHVDTGVMYPAMAGNGALPLTYYKEENAYHLKDAEDYVYGMGMALSRDFTGTIDHFAEVGDPAQIIISTASRRRVDAIVMSTHGRSGVSRLLMGSCTEKVLRGAPCPVLVIPPLKD
jgi:nucleotide-binding universal stress UspA family protein